MPHAQGKPGQFNKRRLHRGRFQAGFTLIELITVIAALTTAIGLLLPAVQSARDHAARLNDTLPAELGRELATLSDESAARLQETRRQVGSGEREKRDVAPQVVEGWILPFEQLAGRARELEAKVGRIPERNLSAEKRRQIRELRATLRNIQTEAAGGAQRARSELRKAGQRPPAARGMESSLSLPAVQRPMAFVLIGLSVGPRNRSAEIRLQPGSEAATYLLQAAAKGQHIPEVKLTARKAGGKQQDYFIVTMNDVLVSSYHPGGVNGDIATLNFSLIQGDVAALQGAGNR